MLKTLVNIFNQKTIKIKNLWLLLIGKPDEFSLETRVFHSISIGVILIGCFYVPYNIYAQLYAGAFFGLLLGLIYYRGFYLSRYKGKKHNSTLFGLIGLFIFSISFFTNSGIHGSTDVIWPSYLLLVLTISPFRQQLMWLFIYLITFSAVHVIAYYNPTWVQYPFEPGNGQLMDRMTAIPMPVISIFLIIRIIRRSYDSEKKATDIKAAALKESNNLILAQKEELQQSNSEKNKLMSIISHDLRSPLINIQNYLFLLNDKDVTDSERPQLENALLESTNNAVDMLSNLLNWSKSQMDGVHVKLIATNLTDALLSTLKMQQSFAQHKNITLNYQLAKETFVIIDVDMLQLVVRNLLSNAIKFTPIGGQINVNTVVENNYCKLIVEDNGSGVPDHLKDEVFSIKSAPTFGTANEKGVGLGLALCKEFIERQGGSIGLANNLQGGASFYILIPLA